MTPAETERAEFLTWLRQKAGPQAIQMMLAADLQTGTATKRAKAKFFAAGATHVVQCIIAAIERGDHLTQKATDHD